MPQTTVSGKIYFLKQDWGQVGVWVPPLLAPRPSCLPVPAAADLSGLYLTWFTLQPTWNSMLRGGGRRLLPGNSNLHSLRRSWYGPGVPGPGSLYLLFLGCGGLWHGGPVSPSHRGLCHRLFLRLTHLRGCHYHLPQSHLVGLLVLW